MNQPTKPTKLFGIAEGAEMLGLKPATLRDWVWRRRIEFVRVGRCIRFREGALHAVIERGTVPARRDAQ